MTTNSGTGTVQQNFLNRATLDNLSNGSQHEEDKMKNFISKERSTGGSISSHTEYTDNVIHTTNKGLYLSTTSKIAYANEAIINNILTNLITIYDIHITTDGKHYFTDPLTSELRTLKKNGMCIRFSELIDPKSYKSFLYLLHEMGRVHDCVHCGPNPPPNAFHIQKPTGQDELLQKLFRKVFAEWPLGHVVTRELMMFYRYLGGNQINGEISMGKATSRFINDYRLTQWVHKRSGFQIGESKHLVGRINTAVESDRLAYTLLPDRRGKSWGIANRITGKAIVKSISIDLDLTTNETEFEV